jgi:8-oxo-dGTP pyrophosphatase MutT (NUDIX family)
VAHERAKRETSAGGVVVRRTVDGVVYLLIHDGHRNWGFPKGHLDRGEGPAEAARREVAEETGLTGLALHDDLGPIDWYFRHHGRLIHKFCHFFLFSSESGEPVPQGDEGIAACTWLAFDEARARLTHENSRRILEAAEARVGAGLGDPVPPG